MKTSGPVLFRSDRFINRYLWEVLPDGSWKDRECFIIGGGPSLREFDWSLLRGRRTIGVNRAFEKHDPTITFSMDTRFLNWLLLGKYGEEVKAKFLSSKSYRVMLCTYTLKVPDYYFILRVHKNYRYGLKAFTFGMKDGIGHGNNSGYAALNLAVCLQANPIYLLGFDCKHDGVKSHWHNGYPVPQSEAIVKKFSTFFANAAQQIKNKGFRVVNLNPDSGLGCFEKMSVEEVL